MFTRVLIIFPSLAWLLILFACGGEEIGKNSKSPDELPEEEQAKLLNLYEFTQGDGVFAIRSHMLIYEHASNERTMFIFKNDGGRLAQPLIFPLTNYRFEFVDGHLKGYGHASSNPHLYFTAKQLSSNETMPPSVIRFMDLIERAKDLNQKFADSNNELRLYITPFNEDISFSQHQVDLLNTFQSNHEVLVSFLNGRHNVKVMLVSSGYDTHQWSGDNLRIGKKASMSPTEWIDRMRKRFVLAEFIDSCLGGHNWKRFR